MIENNRLIPHFRTTLYLISRHRKHSPSKAQFSVVKSVQIGEINSNLIYVSKHLIGKSLLLIHLFFRCVQPELKSLAVGLYTLVMRMLGKRHPSD